MIYLKTFEIWAGFTFIPLLVLYLAVGQPKTDYLGAFGPSLLIPAIGSTIIGLLFLCIDPLKNGVKAGVLLGLAIPLLGAFVWMRIFPGFESQAAIFTGSVMIAVPSAAGGGLAGWLHARRSKQRMTAAVPR